MNAIKNKQNRVAKESGDKSIERCADSSMASVRLNSDLELTPRDVKDMTEINLIEGSRT